MATSPIKRERSGIDLFAEGVLVDLTIEHWQARRSNDARDLGLHKSEVPGFVAGLGTKRLVPKDLTDEWTRIAQAARYVLRRHSFLFPVANVAYVPAKVWPQVEADLTDLQTRFFAARDHLGAHYEEIKETQLASYPKHRKRLEPLYPSKDDAVASFKFFWTPFTLHMPKRAKLALLDERQRAADIAAQEHYQKQLDEQVNAFVMKSVNTLRAKMADIADSIVAKIRSGEVVTNRSLNTLRENVERFKALNFADDREVEARLDRLVQEIAGQDAGSFDDEALRQRLARSLDDLKTVATSISDLDDLTGRYTRRLAL